MTWTVPPATAQWGPAEPALPLGSQARECGWRPSRPPPPAPRAHDAPQEELQPRPALASTPASQQPLQIQHPTWLTHSFWAQVKSGLVLGPSARKHLFLTRVQVPTPPPPGHFKARFWSRALLPVLLWARARPSPGRAPARPARPGPGMNTSLSGSLAPCPSPLSSIPVTSPRLIFLSVQKGG